MKGRFFVLILLLVAVSLLSGCATIQKAHRADELEKEVAQLKDTLEQLKKENENLMAQKQQAVEQRQKELSELEKAKQELAESLKKEIQDYKAKLELTERGLVITFLAEVFFDSGKDVIRTDGKDALNKVAEVLNINVPDSPVAVEGHTDTDPIKYSGWKSNWELSSARALAVLHYFIDECKVIPGRLSANGYGEYRPVATNDTPEGKQQNRRVEIVILPSKIKKVKAD